MLGFFFPSTVTLHSGLRNPRNPITPALYKLQRNLQFYKNMSLSHTASRSKQVSPSVYLQDSALQPKRTGAAATAQGRIRRMELNGTRSSHPAPLRFKDTVSYVTQPETCLCKLKLALDSRSCCPNVETLGLQTSIATSLHYTSLVAVTAVHGPHWTEP